jgi:hypothetical protein
MQIYQTSVNFLSVSDRRDIKPQVYIPISTALIIPHSATYIVEPMSLLCMSFDGALGFKYDCMWAVHAEKLPYQGSCLHLMTTQFHSASAVEGILWHSDRFKSVISLKSNKANASGNVLWVRTP